MTQQHFPFSAVSGQALFKTALILNAINPAIGGVLVNGPRGSAKSTLARGFAEILPPVSTNSESGHLVTLPLSATEDMLVGSLDLQQVLTDKSVNFKPGLLAKAHQGILYVDEVNLLADPLVDLLLDVSASGINYVERDGISHQHAANFVLLGTMNPEEGELRAQLLDRFGLSVQLSNQFSIAERVEIVTLREAFDQDPAEFIQQYHSQQQAVRQSIINAREQLQQIQISMAMRIEIAERSAAAAVDGLRADIVWLKAAQAHAAWQGNAEISLTDIEAVEELVLSHRRQQGATTQANSSKHSQDNTSEQAPESQQQAPESKKQAPQSQETSQEKSQQPPQTKSEAEFETAAQSANASDMQDNTQPKSDEFNGKQQADQQSEWGAMPAQGQQSIPLTEQPRFMRHRAAKKKHYAELVADKTQPMTAKNKQGNIQGGQKTSRQQTQQPDWLPTLINSLGQWPPQQIKYKNAKLGQPSLHFIMLDTSGSILQNKQLGQAKSVIMAIAEQVYQQRQQLCIFGFGNDNVELIMAQQKAPKQLQLWLDDITAGGGTPIRDMLQQVRAEQHKLAKQNSGYRFYNYLITDGRIRQDIDDLPLLGDTLLIDSEEASVKRGRGVILAEQLAAEYCALSS